MASLQETLKARQTANVNSQHQPPKEVKDRPADIPMNKKTETAASHRAADRPAADEPEEKVFLYSCPHSEAMKVNFTDGTVTAKDGVLTLNEVQHKELQMLIKKHQRFDLAQNCIFLDPEAAEKTAREYQAAHPKNPAAQKGATSSAGTMARMQTLEGHQVPNALAGMDVVELDAVHAEDGSFNPEGEHAGEAFTE
jgi:hypothetical protein